MLRYSSLCFIAPLDHERVQVFKMKQHIQVFPAASNSTILTLASYVLWRNPHLLPQEAKNMRCQKMQNYERQKSFPSTYLSLHPYFQIWSDALCKTVFEGNARRQGQTIYIGMRVSQEYLQELQKDEWLIQNFHQHVKIEEIFNLKVHEPNPKNIALFNLAASQLRTDKYQPKINLPALIMGTMFNNEKWKSYNILKNQIPSEEQLLYIDSGILPGSTISVNDNNPQFKILLQRIKIALKKSKKLRIVGICFGHQFIAKLKKVSVEKRKCFRGLENIQFDNTIIMNYKFLQPLQNIILKETLLPEYHEDYIEKVPKGFHLLGKSESCKIQALVSKDGKFLSFQFHPEYFSEYTMSYSYRAQQYSNDFIPNFGFNVENENKKKHHESCEAVRKCISLFIRHEI